MAPRTAICSLVSAFRRTRFLWTVLALALAAWIVRARHPAPAAGPPLPDPTLAAELFPGAAAVRTTEDRPGGWLRVEDAGGRLLGIFAASSPGMDDVTGYAGPTPLLVGLAPDGRIRGVHLLPNRETPGYLRRIRRSGFLDSWTGRTIPEAAALDVDAVSGATRTCTAIAQTLRGCLERLEPDAEQALAPPGASNGFRLEFTGLDAAIIGLLLAGLVLEFHPRLAARPRLRRLGLAAALILLGGFAGGMVSMELLAAWAATGRIPGGIGIGLLVLTALLLPMVTGRNVYCRRFCPFGAAQEWLDHLTPARRRISPALARILRPVRYLILLGMLVALTGDLPFRPALQEPFSAFRWSAAGWTARILAAAALLASLAGVFRPWCTYFCSTGALLDLLKRPTGPKQ